VVIADDSSMTVTFKIARNSRAHIQAGDEITLRDGENEYTGHITEIGAAVDMSGLFPVKAETQGGLVSGASVKVFAKAQKAENITVVPLGVVHYEGGIPYVYVADGGYAKKTRVEVGLFNAHDAEIISGIAAGDRIISTWSSRLSDGAGIAEGQQ
jgi:multidrug efflux pump subunit AcrA (membrane-fusion protein)